MERWVRGIVFGALLLALLGVEPARSRGQDAEAAKFLAAQEKAIAALAQAQAVDAAVWGSPLVVMYCLRQNDALGPQAKALPNAIWRMENISTPKLSEEAGYVTPNVNTIYGFGFLDLGPKPLVLNVPDSNGRYYMVEIVDMWTNAFAYAGGTATGYKGGKFALVGPGWKGELPAGVKRIDCPTRWVLIQPRVHLRNQAELAEAQKVMRAITVEDLNGGKPANGAYKYPVPVLTNPKLPVSALAFKDPLQFWEILAEAMIENPPPADQLTALVPLFQQLGLTAGKAWDRTKVSPPVLEAMKAAAENVPNALTVMPAGELRNGWRFPPPSMGNFGTDYMTRAITARVGLTGNIPREAIYVAAMMTGERQSLTGANRYTLTFKTPPPFIQPGFWSVTMYDAVNNYSVPNPINRYSLGSDNPDMKRGADGSLTIYFQKDSPGKDLEANWLPTPPGRFYLILRSYAPGEAMVKSLTDPTAFPLPPIMLVK